MATDHRIFSLLYDLYVRSICKYRPYLINSNTMLSKLLKQLLIRVLYRCAQKLLNSTHKNNQKKKNWKIIKINLAINARKKIFRILFRKTFNLKKKKKRSSRIHGILYFFHKRNNLRNFKNKFRPARWSKYLHNIIKLITKKKKMKKKIIPRFISNVTRDT